MTENVITARGLTKRYRRTTVIDAIDFDVAKGEIFGFLGPNGAGKTTTILMMLGLTDVTAGEVRVLGHDPVRQPLAVKRRVGYLPDSVGFYDYLTAAENLVYTARLMGFAPAASFCRAQCRSLQRRCSARALSSKSTRLRRLPRTSRRDCLPFPALAPCNGRATAIG